jgi:hypothetical protein
MPAAPGVSGSTEGAKAFCIRPRCFMLDLLERFSLRVPRFNSTLALLIETESKLELFVLMSTFPSYCSDLPLTVHIVSFPNIIARLMMMARVSPRITGK